MYGPIAFATPIGSRRQTAIIALYFGFDGLFCGITVPRRSAYS